MGSAVTQPALNRNPELQIVLTPPKFRFSHDLESLWWIALWILIYRVAYPEARALAKDVYTHDFRPTDKRKHLFKMGNCSGFLRNCIRPDLADCALPLAEFRNALYESYQDKSNVDNMLNPTSYVKTYCDTWTCLCSWMDVITTVVSANGNIVLEDMDDGKPQSPQPEHRQNKRPHTWEEDEDEFLPRTKREGEATQEREPRPKQTKVAGQYTE